MSKISGKVLMFGSWLFNIGPFAGDPKSWDDVIELAAKLGFGGVAPGGFGTHLTPAKLSTPDKISAVNEAMGKLGLALGTIAADIWGASTKWLTDEGRTAYEAAVRAFIDLAAALGITAVRIDPNYAHWEIPGDELGAARTRFCEMMRRLGGYAQSKGVTIQIEAEPPWAFLTTVQGCCDLIDEINHPAVRLMYDYCHFNRIIQDPSDHYDSHVVAIRKLGDRIGSQHISDNLGGQLVFEKGFDHPPTARHLPLGDGDIPLAEIAAELEKIPAIAASTEVTLDMCFYVGQYPDVLAQSLKAMQEIYEVAG